jgi:OOP family OmpA-OmpF porin
VPGPSTTKKKHPGGAEPTGHSDDWQSLRQLLVGPERTRIENIERSMPTARSIGEVLPEAMAHAVHVRGDELVTSAVKPVTGALREIARREPHLFGDILAPTIGTAVRRAVMETIAIIMQRLNQLLERGLSLQSVMWRIESARTRRPYAEIMLAHTLVYRVEWAVLIDTETSLVVDQAIAEAPLARAPDQVSAMLQAIGSFVGEAFQPLSPGGELRTVEVGDITLWIERDPLLTLALAVRGAAPLEMRQTLRRTLERVRTDRIDVLASGQPDAAQLAIIHPLLADCLQQQVKPTRKRAQWLVAILAIIAAAAVGLTVVRAVHARHAEASRRAAYQATLSAQPGIVVTAIDRARNGFRIRGLRDPRAAPADQVLAQAGLPPAKLELAPFDSLDPRLQGRIPTIDAALRPLEQLEITFERGHAAIAPADRATIERAVGLIFSAQRAAAVAGLGLCVEIIGHTDDTGSAAFNESLRLVRATAVIDAIGAAGVPTEWLNAHAADPMLPGASGRRVTFRGVLRPAPAHPGCAP